MSSKNYPSILSLVSAIQGGLSPGQDYDLMKKIASDLNDVWSQVDEGPLPRVLERAEIDGAVAYIDVANIFTKQNTFAGINITGGTIIAGSLIFESTTHGLALTAKTGGVHDFELIDPAGNLVFHLLTGSRQIVLADGLIFGGISAAFAANRLFKSATHGTVLTGVGGTFFDFYLADGVGNAYVAVPTATLDLLINGSIKQNTAAFIEFKELAADPAAGAANTGRLYVKDNGAGKTQLCIIFNTGATQVIATQP